MTKNYSTRIKWFSVLLGFVVFSALLWFGLTMRPSEGPSVPLRPVLTSIRSLGNSVTLEEANERALFPVPVPTYLPEECSVDEIRGYRGVNDDSYWEVRIFCSEEGAPEDLVIIINWWFETETEETIRHFIDQTERSEIYRLIELKGMPGYAIELGHINKLGEPIPALLVWYDNDLKFEVRGFLPLDELWKIAESLEYPTQKTK